MRERWVGIFNERYDVSNYGRVRNSRSGRLLKPRLNADGYLVVELRPEENLRFSTSVHVLVAAAFIGPRPPGKEVNHKDGIKTTNAPKNLEYVTHDENMKHAKTFGLLNPRVGELNGASKLKEKDVQYIRRYMQNVRWARRGFGMSLLAEKYGVKVGTVQAVVYGRIWKSVLIGEDHANRKNSSDRNSRTTEITHTS